VGKKKKAETEESKKVKSRGTPAAETGKAAKRTQIKEAGGKIAKKNPQNS